MVDLLQRFGYAERAVYPPRSIPIHAALRAAGIARETDRAYDWRGLSRGPTEFALLQHTLGGQGRLTYEGTSYDVKPGTTMLLHIPHDHRYWLADGTHWEFYYVLLTGSEVLRLWRELLIRTGPLLELRPDGAARRLAEEACARVLDGTITSAFTSSALAYSLTMALLEESAPTWAEAQTPAFVTKVESYCRRHLARPIGVEDMARAAGMSRYHFSRRFREARGVSPGRYLAELRLREAVRLLQDKTLSIKEIAARSGYTDAGYLLKVFRKNFGMSTRRFREEGGASG